MEKEKNNSKRGFTLLELLVVILIIGILAAIAFPKYQMAVTKAKVASVLPIMRRWKDALQEYKLKYGDYQVEDYSAVDANWPSDWSDGHCGNNTECYTDYWYSCMANEEEQGEVYCQRYVNDVGDTFVINIYQPDDPDEENFRNKVICTADGNEGHKVCKALGGRPIDGDDSAYELY